MVLNDTKKLFLLMICLILIMTACSKPGSPTIQTNQEGSDDMDYDILMVGLKDKEINLSIQKIKEFPAISKSVVAVSSSGGETHYEATGTLLEEILNEYGVSQKDLAAIRFVAGDGYSVEVPEEILHVRDIILTYEIDGGPLKPDEIPIRVVIPEERAMYWVANLEKIEVVKNVEHSDIGQIIFLETFKETVDLEDYAYNESIDKAINNQDFFTGSKDGNDSNTVFIKALDGLEKNETMLNFVDAYIKITGDDVPAFLSPDMPKGMTVRDILFFSHGETAWVSNDRLYDKIEMLEIDQRRGISLESLFRMVDFAKGEKYVFSALAGSKIEIKAEDIHKGLLCKNDKGVPCVIFKGMPSLSSSSKNLELEEILSIEVIR